MIRTSYLLRYALPIGLGTFLGLWAASLLADDAFRARGTLHDMNYTRDDQFAFYTITFAGDEGGIWLSVDKKLPLATWLQQHQGARITFTLESTTPNAPAHITRQPH